MTQPNRLPWGYGEARAFWNYYTSENFTSTMWITWFILVWYKVVITGAPNKDWILCTSFRDDYISSRHPTFCLIHNQFLSTMNNFFFQISACRSRWRDLGQQLSKCYQRHNIKYQGYESATGHATNHCPQSIFTNNLHPSSSECQGLARFYA